MPMAAISSTDRQYRLATRQLSRPQVGQAAEPLRTYTTARKPRSVTVTRATSYPCRTFSIAETRPVPKVRAEG